jgi:beta-glucosidase
MGIKPAFSFGHGLSYTIFEYRALLVQPEAVEFDVINSGKVAGSEVAQM